MKRFIIIFLVLFLILQFGNIRNENRRNRFNNNEDDNLTDYESLIINYKSNNSFKDDKIDWRVWQLCRNRVPLQQDPHAIYSSWSLDSDIDFILFESNYPNCAYFNFVLYQPLNYGGSDNVGCVINSLKDSKVKPTNKNPFNLEDYEGDIGDNKFYFVLYRSPLVFNFNSILEEKGIDISNINFLEIPNIYSEYSINFILRYYLNIVKIGDKLSYRLDDLTTEDINNLLPKTLYIHKTDKTVLDVTINNSLTIYNTFEDGVKEEPYIKFLNEYLYSSGSINPYNDLPINQPSTTENIQRFINFYLSPALPITQNVCESNKLSNVCDKSCSCASYFLCSLGTFKYYILKIYLPKTREYGEDGKYLPSIDTENLEVDYFSVSTYGSELVKGLSLHR